MSKKVLVLIVIVALIASVLPMGSCVLASSVPQVLPFTSPILNVSATANSTGTNKSWIKWSQVDLKDDLFTDAYRLTCIGTDAAPGSNQFRFQFQEDVPNMYLNEYCYFSIYYRVNSTDGENQYTVTPPAFLIAPFNMNSGNIKGSDVKNFDVWKKIYVTAKLTTNITSGSMYVQLTFPRPTEKLSPYCIDFACPTFIYFGMPDGETDTEKEMNVDSYLSDSTITEVTLNGDPISLEQYPDGYSSVEIWNEETSFEASGVNSMGEDCEVVQSAPDIYPLEFNIISYAKNYDFTDPDNKYRSEYKISLTPAEATPIIMSGDYEITDLSEIDPGDTIKLYTEFNNYKKQDKTYIEIVKIYNKNKVIKIFAKKFEVDSSTEWTYDEFEFAVPTFEGFNEASLASYVLDADTLCNVAKAY